MIFILTLIGVAYPCKCVKSTLKNNYKKADAVVVSKVLNIYEQAENVIQVELEIQNAWKSNLPRTLTIIIEKDSCEYQLKKGEKHLLYLELLGSGKFTTNNCRGNLSENKSARAKKWLRSYAKKSIITSL
jgi:hypothetical protein